MSWQGWFKGFILSKILCWVIVMIMLALVSHYYMKNPKYKKIAEDVTETVIEDELKLPQGTIKHELEILDDEQKNDK